MAGVLRQAVPWAFLLVMIAAGFRDLPPLQLFFVGGEPPLGWDLDGVCNSLHALRIGHDPYLESSPLPMPYAILHLYPWSPLCGHGPVAYAIAYCLIALASGLMLWRIVPATAIDRAAVLAAIFLGFGSFAVLVHSGNPGIGELPLAAAIVLLLNTGRYQWAAVLFGLMASFKLLPMFGAPAFLFLPFSLTQRVQTFALAVGAFAAVHLVNAALFAEWLPSYLHYLTGRLPGGAFYEPGDNLNQDTIDFVVNGLQQLGVNGPLPGFALACLGLGAAWLTALACARKGPHRAELPPDAVVSLIVLVLWLFLFRQKDYAFATFVPFMICAGYGAGRVIAHIAMAASIVVPSALISHTIKIPYLYSYYHLMGAWAAVAVLVCGTIIGQSWQSSRSDERSRTGEGALDPGHRVQPASAAE